MAYEDIESSIDQGEPVTLFEFIYGESTSDAYRYATSVSRLTDTVLAAGMQWMPFQIRHGDITNSGNLDRAPLAVTMSLRAEVASLFKSGAPSQPVRLRIWRGHAVEDDYQLIWSGRVLDAEWEDAEVTIQAEPLATSLRRVGLRRFYQYGCSHVLYGEQCKASKVDNTGTGTVVNSPNAATVDVQIDSTPIALVANHLIGGVFRVTQVSGLVAMRTVTMATELSSNVFRLTLMSPVADLSNGLPMAVSRGCTHNFQTCRDRFNNTPNYGGFPNIPTKNPFTGNSF